MAGESEVDRENREGEKEMAENEGANEGTKETARGSKAANRRSSSQKELFSVPAFRQSKARTGSFIPLSSVLSIFRESLARIMKARILPPIVPDSTMPDVVYFFYKA